MSSVEVHLLKVTLVSALQIRRWKWRKKREQFRVSEVEFNFEISSGIKTLPIDPVFSSWFKLIKKSANHKMLKKLTELKGAFIFFFEIREIFSTKSVFLFCLLEFITLFPLSVAYVQLFKFF